MNFWIIFGIILLIMIAVLIGLYFFGKKIEKRNAANQEAIEASSQVISMLVIDKKKMKLKDANLPKIVLDQTPKYLRRSKVPIVKAKVGPRVMTMMCDPKVFDVIPLKQEVKATVSGIYITNVKGKLLPKPTKLTWRQKLANKYSSTSNTNNSKKKRKK